MCPGLDSQRVHLVARSLRTDVAGDLLCVAWETRRGQVSQWPCGVTASTLDPESSNRGSNPRKALVALLLFVAWRGVCRAAAALHATPPALIEAWPSTIDAEARPPVTCAGWQPFANMLQPKLGVEVNTLTLDVSFRYSLAGQDTRPSPERPGFEPRWRKWHQLAPGWMGPPLRLTTSAPLIHLGEVARIKRLPPVPWGLPCPGTPSTLPLEFPVACSIRPVVSR